MLIHTKSEQHYLEACRYLAGGVGSNARLTPNLVPLCFERGAGSHIFDVDGNEYIDYILGLGPLILGHCPSKVVASVKQQVDKGSLFGSAAVGEDVLARLVCECIPSVDLVSFTSSASEAVHMAIRLARAYTGKTKILKFEGCYHGWFDEVMASVHPEFRGAMGLENFPQPLPEGPGQSKNSLSDILIAPFNQPEAVEKIFKRHGNEIAALIVEPIPVNNGVIIPQEGFLESLRVLSRDNDCMLIFDETVSGFRISLGGAQEYYNVMPDLTVFGKGVGGGYPIAGFGGVKEVMDLIVERKVGRAGTYNSNSLCVAAAISVLEELSNNNGMLLDQITILGEKLMQGIIEIFSKQGLPLKIQGVGAIFSTFFTEQTIRNYRDTFKLNDEMFLDFWKGLLRRGIRIWSTSRSLWFLSTAHTEMDIELTLEKIEETLMDLKKTHR
jgi:glutamate-1-semialdehyde 2,1-aminomutase